MRIIDEHKINPVNDKVNILVLDEPGAGGANHVYKYEFPDGKYDVTISFQNGPIVEHGVNGVTQEILLVTVADRLRSFQAGPYACRENAIALTKVEEALNWLNRRTYARMRRGVEGTMSK